MNLREAYLAYENQWTHWLRTDEVYPKEAYWHALDQFVATVALPVNVQPWQHTAAAALIRAWIAFVPLLEAGEALQPSTAVYDAIKRLMDAKQEIKKPTETPEELAEQGVSMEQIGKMMGWDAIRLRKFEVAFSIMKRGRGEYIEADLKRDPQTPEERHRIEMAKRDKDDFLKAGMEWRQFASSRIEAGQQILDQPADDWKAPPETIQELHAQGVPVEQIARMWRKSQPEVVAIIQGGNVATMEPTENDIANEIREAFAEDGSLTHAELAEMFGVDETIVGEVLS